MYSVWYLSSRTPVKRNHQISFLGDYIQIEERSPEEVKQGKRLVREGEEEDVSGSDDERMDMADITGKKELRQREEAFLEAQQCKSLMSVYIEIVWSNLYFPLLFHRFKRRIGW